jgi:hypothetical protein
MKDCSKFEDSIQSLIAGTPRLEQLEELVEHCKSCRDCRDLYEMHRTLAHLGSKFDELEAVDFSRERSRIVKTVAAGSKRRRKSRWATLFRTPLALQPLAAVALLAVVFVLGLVASRLIDRSPLPPKESIEGTYFSASIMDPDNSPYAYSNISIKYLDEKKIRLAFDVTRHIEIVDQAQSEQVKGILIHSLLNPSPTGAVGHFQTRPVKGGFYY